jgi:hypothetical protein
MLRAKLSPSRTLAVGLFIGALGATACAHHRAARTVGLLATNGIPLTTTPSRDVPLEVVTRSTAIADPLPVDGTDTYYVQVETALGHAVASATTEWAAHTTLKQPGGYRLFVELVAARVSYEDARLLVSFDVRATLHTRATGDYVAQSLGHCKQGSLDTPEQGAPVVYSCMTQIGRDLSAWLGRLDL